VEYDSVIVRFGGEIGIKGRWTRRTYEKMLLRNVKKALKHYNIPYEKIIHKQGRMYINTNETQGTASMLTWVFGVSSVSPAVETVSGLNEIVQKAVELADNTLKRGGSFAVRCRRIGEQSYSSMDVCREAGKQILAKLENRDLRVDLKNPQFTVGVEVRDEYAYIFSETLQCSDGFPLGSQPRVICLLSGGIDSAVACWLAMKRGCPIIPVYFDIETFTDEAAATSKVLDVARKLFEWSIGFPRKVYIVPHGRNLETFMRENPRKLTCVLCKRMMYRIAEQIAETEKAEGIVTGEAIGEHASQTLTNLRVLNEAVTEYPVHRPLLGFNKLEIVRLAQKIGTFKISTRRAGGCSAVPKRPSTRARLRIVRKTEQELDIEGMIEESVRATRIVTV